MGKLIDAPIIVIEVQGKAFMSIKGVYSALTKALDKTGHDYDDKPYHKVAAEVREGGVYKNGNLLYFRKQIIRK